MVETLQNMHDVFAKWESRNPYGPNRSNGTCPTLQPAGKNIDLEKTLAEGKKAWREKMKDAGPPPNRRHRNRGEKVQALSVGRAANLGYFKSTPTILPVSNKSKRPWMGRCCSCMPASKDDLFEDTVNGPEMYDIFSLKNTALGRNFFARRFRHITFAFKKKVDHKYPDVSIAVLKSSKVTEAIQRTVCESQNAEDMSEIDEKLFDKCQKCQQRRALGIVTRMKARISNGLIRFTGWFLHKLLGSLLSTILVHRGQMQMVKKAMEKNVPVIFLPTHRSHLDYILITFIIHNFDLQAPHVAAGDNLHIPIFSSLMRGLGGYFIRRKLDTSGKKDHVYRAVLHSYMESLLCNRQHFEFFIEGGRTRSGKALHPKGGLLSIIVDSFQKGLIPDCYLVPVGISYDRLLDGNFTNEQMGRKKVNETFWRTIKAIWKSLMRRFGNVRVDFAQPFSLKEYLQVSPSFNLQALCHPQPSLSPSSPVGSMRTACSDNSIYGTDVVAEDQRTVIQGLATHVIYDAVRCQALMSTHLVTFLLLNKYREGVSLDTFSSTLDWLRAEISLRHRDVGFCGKSTDVVESAVDLLGSSLIKKEKSKDDKEIRITPVTTLPVVFELQYYANIVSCVFVNEAVLATALYSMVEAEQWQGAGHNDVISISKNQLCSAACEIFGFLQFEFIFKPTCTVWETVLDEAVEQLLAMDILIVDKEESTKEKEYAQRLIASSGWEDEVDSDESIEEIHTPDVIYKVNHDSKLSMEKLKFLCNIVEPFLETYFVLACHLSQLLERDLEEEVFVHSVHLALKERVHKGVATFAESAGMDSLKNAVKSFHELKITESYKDENFKMICLRQKYKDQANLNGLVEKLESYRS